MLLLGLDIGSSSVKAALVDGHARRTLAAAQSPDTEMAIAAPRPGWAEQSPEMWWENVRRAIQKTLAAAGADPADIGGIGISYQMHGLVCLDRTGQPLRPAIIWCDSRAVDIGNQAFEKLGADWCLWHLLNSPGNFTASKLAWVREHEPDVFSKIWRIGLPGDYIAGRMTGEFSTTVSGLSEGIFWDFRESQPAQPLLDLYKISPEMLAPIVPTFGEQGKLTASAAAELGLKPGTPVAYRAGDQPNNALSLNVLQPGEVAATGGTSGVVYGVADAPVFDPAGRVNGFAHVNHEAAAPRIGVLLCINGAGSLYRWVRQNLPGADTPYSNMEQAAAAIPPGADGLTMLPFGNGAERMLGNAAPGASLLHLDLNRHERAHIYRAALEGIAFAFVHGMEVFGEMGMATAKIRVGTGNLFESGVFARTISSLTGAQIEMLETNGAVGAAFGAGHGVGFFATPGEGLAGLRRVKIYEPERASELCREAYGRWLFDLKKLVGLGTDLNG
ncbi:MAG: xylulokinase [Saprospiraceae bacterium]